MISNIFDAKTLRISFSLALVLVYFSSFSEPIWAQSRAIDRKIIDLHKDNSDFGETGQTDFQERSNDETHARDWDFEGDGRSKPIARGGSRFNFDGDGQPRSGERNGGASRGSCPVSDRPLTALIPKINLGLTTDSHPTFWFYVPDDMASVTQGEFMLLDKENNPAIDEPIIIELSETPGLVSVSLPETAKSLEVGREYHWFFAILCDRENPSQNPTVDGWIQRVEPSTWLGNEPDVSLAEEPDIRLAEELAQTPDAEHYIIYANHGIWYDALTELIKQYRTQQANPILEADWLALLEAVCLEEISATPE